MVAVVVVKREECAQPLLMKALVGATPPLLAAVPHPHRELPPRGRLLHRMQCLSEARLAVPPGEEGTPHKHVITATTAITIEAARLREREAARDLRPFGSEE